MLVGQRRNNTVFKVAFVFCCSLSLCESVENLERKKKRETTLEPRWWWDRRRVRRFCHGYCCSYYSRASLMDYSHLILCLTACLEVVVAVITWLRRSSGSIRLSTTSLPLYVFSLLCNDFFFFWINLFVYLRNFLELVKDILYSLYCKRGGIRLVVVNCNWKCSVWFV